MKRLLVLCVVLAFGASSGCKKSTEGTDKKAAEPSAPAEEKKAEDPAAAPEAPPAKDVVAAPADVVATPADAAAQPKADAVATPPADVKPAADTKVATPPVGTEAAKPAEPVGAEAAKPSEADVKTEAPVAPAAEKDSPHWGEKFNLDAIMVTSDLVNQPEHYSQFPHIKVRGRVLSLKDKMVFVGTKTTEGLWSVAVRLTQMPARNFEVGQIVYLEGKLLKEAWTLDAVDAGRLKDGGDLKYTSDWLLEAVSGEFEEHGPK